MQCARYAKLAVMAAGLAVAGCASTETPVADTTTTGTEVGGFGGQSAGGSAPGGLGGLVQSGDVIGGGGVYTDVGASPVYDSTGTIDSGAIYNDGTVYGTGETIDLGAYDSNSLYDQSAPVYDTYSDGGAESLGAYNFPGDTGGPDYFAREVGDTVLFDTDSATLNDAQRDRLRRQAAWLQLHPTESVTIEGHADERGTREHNLALGARRANAVRSYLSSLGVSSDRIRTVSFGKERPVAIGSDARSWAANRRAVTVLAVGYNF